MTKSEDKTMKKIEGGITAAKGFQAAGGAAGIKKQGVKDMKRGWNVNNWE